MEKGIYEQLVIREIQEQIEHLDSLGDKTQKQPLDVSTACETKARQPKWEREEVVLLVSEYYRIKNLPKTEQKRSIEFISKLLRIRAEKLGMNVDERYRNIAGIKMKFGNMQALDKEEIEAGHLGLKNVSALEKKTVEEYNESPIKINQEAYLIIMEYVWI